MHYRKFLWLIVPILLSMTLFSGCRGGDRAADLLALDDDEMAEIIAAQAFTTYHNRTVEITTENFYIGLDCGADITYLLVENGLCYERQEGTCVITTNYGEVSIDGDFLMCVEEGAILGQGGGVEDFDGVSYLTIEGDIAAEVTTPKDREYETTGCDYEFTCSNIEVVADSLGEEGIDFEISMDIVGTIQCGERDERYIERSLSFALEAHVETSEFLVSTVIPRQEGEFLRHIQGVSL